MENEEKVFRYWLNRIPGIGSVTAIELVKKLGSAKAVYLACENQLKKLVSPKQLTALRNKPDFIKLQKEYTKVGEKKIQMVFWDEKAYPARLKTLKDAPFVLYYIGKLPKEEENTIAIIGARECSAYGSYVARAFAEKLAKENVSVVSGMARGIDGIAQEAALEAEGESYAVLGCGVDICYPARNRDLYERLKKKGGIISPYPPGTAAVRTLFPYRNKIVAALSDAILVIEARQKSGTLITVDMALEQGKDVYAVPGRLTDRLSDGCNCLIRQGAGIALSPEDILKEMHILQNRGINFFPESEISQKEAEKEEVLRYLDFTPKSIEEILEQIQAEGEEKSLQQLMLELVQLCIAGKAKQTAGHYFYRYR